jgi:hypothetical protein
LEALVDVAIPYGYCQCGCGELAAIAKRTRPYLGHVKGEPTRYAQWHPGGQRKYADTPEGREIQRERQRAKVREYQAANRDTILVKQRAYRERERATVLERQRLYRENHRGQLRAKARAYFAQNRARAIATMRTRKRHRHELIASLKGDTCLDCGGQFASRSLHFHHRDPATKRFNVASGKLYAVATILDEIEKCDVLCPKCHKSRHKALAQQRVSWDDLVCYIEHPSPHLGRQASPHSPPPQAP